MTIYLVNHGRAESEADEPFYDLNLFFAAYQRLSVVAYISNGNHARAHIEVVRLTSEVDVCNHLSADGDTILNIANLARFGDLTNTRDYIF